MVATRKWSARLNSVQQLKSVYNQYDNKNRKKANNDWIASLSLEKTTNFLAVQFTVPEKSNLTVFKDHDLSKSNDTALFQNDKFDHRPVGIQP